MNFKDKVVLITGAGRGIGETIAIEFAKKEAKIVINDIDLINAEKVADKINNMKGEAVAIACDISKADQVKEMVESTIQKYGKLDILINNAGICKRIAIEDLDEKEWDRMMSTNIKGVYLCCQAAIKYMKKKKRGKIINISSIAAKTGGLLVGSHYAASKAGVIAFSKSLARELADYNITVNIVAPGLADTEMAKSFTNEEITRIHKSIPLKRLAMPEDIASAVLFLASEGADYLTGETINVNGGQLME